MEQFAMSNVLFRPAVPSDGEVLTDIFLRAFEVSVPGLALAHTRDEIAVWFASKQIPEKTVTVATIAGRQAGFIAAGDGWVHQLFVAPEHHRKGIGTALIRPVMAASTAPLRLWAFQRNAQARAFYEGLGFAAALFTDGRDNEERTPDVLYVWRPSKQV
jgi:GNAT superfamily N-acetyltransferase